MEKEQNTEPAAAPVQKKKRLALKIILIILGAIVLAGLGGYAYWVIQGPHIELPYGLKPEMSIEELRRAMTDSGFTEERVILRDESDGKKRSRNAVYYLPCEIYGETADIICLDQLDNRISLTFQLETGTGRSGGNTVKIYNGVGYDTVSHTDDSGRVYSHSNPSPGFLHILSELKAEYGSPRESSSGGYARYEWSDVRMNLKIFRISLSYYNDYSYAVSYSWD